MALRDVIELDFEEDPSRLLEQLGLKTNQFEATKSNILTRLMARPELAMIVLEFRRDGMFLGEIKYGDKEHYTDARKKRGEALGRAARRDQDRLKESEVGGDDGILDDPPDRSGWSLEQLLRRAIGGKGSER